MIIIEIVHIGWIYYDFTIGWPFIPNILPPVKVRHILPTWNISEFAFICMNVFILIYRSITNKNIWYVSKFVTYKNVYTP